MISPELEALSQWPLSRITGMPAEELPAIPRQVIAHHIGVLEDWVNDWAEASVLTLHEELALTICLATLGFLYEEYDRYGEDREGGRDGNSGHGQIHSSSEGLEPGGRGEAAEPAEGRLVDGRTVGDDGAVGC